MIISVGLNDIIQLPKAEAEEVVQAFTFKATDPTFDKAIRDRLGDGCEHRPTVITSDRPHLMKKNQQEARIGAASDFVSAS